MTDKVSLYVRLPEHIDYELRVMCDETGLSKTRMISELISLGYAVYMCRVKFIASKLGCELSLLDERFISSVTPDLETKLDCLSEGAPGAH